MNHANSNLPKSSLFRTGFDISQTLCFFNNYPNPQDTGGPVQCGCTVAMEKLRTDPPLSSFVSFTGNHVNSGLLTVMKHVRIVVIGELNRMIERWFEKLMRVSNDCVTNELCTTQNFKRRRFPIDGRIPVKSLSAKHDYFVKPLHRMMLIKRVAYKESCL